MVEKNMFTAMDKKTITEIAESIREELEYKIPQLDNRVSVMGREIEIEIGTKIMECDNDVEICNENIININGKIETNDLEIEIFPKQYEKNYSIIGMGIIITFKNGNIDGYMVNDIVELIHSLISIYR